MSRKIKILLVILILIVDISYTATVFGYDRFFRFDPVSSYIEDVACGLVGGKMLDFSHDCYTERRCFSPYADGGKSCQSSNDCQGKCVLSDSDIMLYCSASGAGTSDLFGHQYCPGLTGTCETHYTQRNFDYNNGGLEADWSGACGL